MIILGIDPGTAKMGWGVIQYKKEKIKDKKGGGVKLVGYGCFVTPVGEKMERRLLSIFRDVRRVVKEQKPDLIILESLFFNTNAKTAISVGQARGVVMLAAAEAKTPLMEYTALQAKMALTGYGRSKKPEIQAAVKKFLGCREKIRPDDAADALALALCYVKKELGIT